MDDKEQKQPLDYPLYDVPPPEEDFDPIVMFRSILIFGLVPFLLLGGLWAALKLLGG